MKSWRDMVTGRSGVGNERPLGDGGGVVRGEVFGGHRSERQGEGRLLGQYMPCLAMCVYSSSRGSNNMPTGVLRAVIYVCFVYSHAGNTFVSSAVQVREMWCR